MILRNRVCALALKWLPRETRDITAVVVEFIQVLFIQPLFVEE